MSLTTLLPTGIISNGPTWCIKELFAWGPDYPPYKYNTCGASSSSNSTSIPPTDFLTICCDGRIIDTTLDMYAYLLSHKTLVTYPLNLSNLLCCREANVRQMGGIGPFPNPTRCDAVLRPHQTPLASLAATNTANAAPYLATYESGRWDNEVSSNVDWIRTETPSCLWVQTAHPEVSGRLGEVVVEEARITTLPLAVTDAAGRTLTGTMTMTERVERTTTTRAVKTTSSSESAGAGMKGWGMGRVVIGLGLVAVLLV